LLAIGWAAAPAVAAESELTIDAIHVGFDGVYKTGHWAPVEIAVSGLRDVQPLSLEWTTADGEFVPATYIEPSAAPDDSSPDGKKRLTGYVKFGRHPAALSVRVLRGGEELARRTFSAGELPVPLESTRELILSLGPSIGEEDAVRRRAREHAAPISVCRPGSGQRLPRQWYGYEGVDTVVAVTSQPSVLEQMDDAQWRAFHHWLVSGGRLILCAGRRATEALAPGSRLAPLAPGPVTAVLPQRTTTGLEDYAGATQRLDEAGGRRVRRFSLDLAAVSPTRGLVEASETAGSQGRVPTVVRAPYGFGQVVFVAFDLDQPPFDRWQGRAGLVARLLQGVVHGHATRSEETYDSAKIVQLGYEDLAGQLRVALDQFSGVRRFEFSWIAALIVVYVVLIGPADYFLLKKLNRLHWTWISFPAVVLLFCLIAVLLASRLTGTRLHVNQVDLVDVDVESGSARSTTWAHLYSPSSQLFNLGADASWPWAGDAAVERGNLFTWHGLPGRGLGGLDRPPTTALTSRAYTVQLGGTPAAANAPPSIRELPLQISSSRSLLVRRWADVRLPPSGELTLDRNGLLSGDLSNPLDVPLSDCMILYQNWVYPLTGALPPGESVSLDGLSPKNLEWRLTRRRVVQTKDISTPWDPMSVDVPRILELLMFYQAAGGLAYADLTHRYQPYTDLSDHLKIGRAVLVGRARSPFSRLARDGQSLAGATDQSWTFFRLVYPVRQPSSGSDGL
jgi:hypothetical protein